MKRALVVGINNYPRCPLQGCINDAKSFRDIIEKNGDKSPNFDVRYVPDVSTKSELKILIRELFSGGCDTEIFYFSGHGFINDLGGYLITPDYSEGDEGVSMSEILAMANNSSSKNRMIILDCCHSGAMGNFDIKNGNCHIAEGVTILTSSKKDQTSLEINGQGVFTTLLLEALKGGAADLSGHITPGSLYSYIDQALGPWDQRPVFKTNITRFTSLKKVNPRISVDVLRKIVIYFPSPENKFKLDPSFEDTNTKVVEHKVIKPYAKEENIKIFKDLQKLQSIGLVIPVDEDYMYFAAMKSKACRLTPLGCHYWNLVKNNRI